MGSVSYSSLSIEVDPTVSAQITALDLINGTQLNTAISGFLTDAPSNGNQYARQNNSWSVVTGGGGGGTSIPAYNNGVTYSVNDQVIYNDRFWYMSISVGAAGYDPIAYPSYWTEISPYTDTGLTDAPSDNVQYVRYNGSWVSNSGLTKTVYNNSGGTYTLVAGDENRVIFMNGGMNGNALYVPADSTYAFPNGTEITIVCDLGSGTNQISGQYAGQPVFNGNSVWSVTITNPVSKLVKVATDTWYYY